MGWGEIRGGFVADVADVAAFAEKGMTGMTGMTAWVQTRYVLRPN